MKKLIIIIGIIILIAAGAIAFLRLQPDATMHSGVYGNSMSQYGLTDGMDIVEYMNHPCKVGDICSFDCLVSKCTTPTGEHLGIKKLISITDNCYWFQGNDSAWIENGHNVASWDSRVYGCLKPSEFKLWGVVVK